MLVQLSALIALSHRVSRWATWIGGGMMLCCAFLVSLDVISRKFFEFSISGSDEITSYVFAIGTTWALAFALLERYHIRIDIIYLTLPRRWAAFLDVLSLLAFLAFAGILSYRATVVFQTSVHFWSTANTPLQTPLAIPQGLWLIGIIGFTLIIVLLLARATIALLKGDLQTINDLAGIRTHSHDIEVERERISVEGEG
ncbi:TRAP transporter small permease subunit [Candidatus Nitrotoga sp. M5]|uniref:TRAP transporter small permease subunit n=1 Tax=Candidatus Nitrotoga sp. M5 TaxID=2890409 RepID=UPI001EF59525|nr:TRAP transporter small permease [Candidatus Nitrotoga sp. M5]CAH1387506.1 conserved membrane hypothetical protein [Candidatus Nitrotoga sp. M5]